MERPIKMKTFLHGGDYNPEQWLKQPEILEKDIVYMKEAKCNVMTLGVFSWSKLEPQEGQYDFLWLETIIDRLYVNGIHVMLATPSGARPKWLSDQYPEVLRVDSHRVRQLFGGRHNHCYTSPIYRKKIESMNHELGKRFANHPALIGWHISNELGGDCHCLLCQDAFRKWLEAKYLTIENLNDKWYTTFWSHTYQNFKQVESPSTIGENGLHGLNLDWKRFVTHQTIDYLVYESACLRSHNALLPITTNFMYYFEGLDYFKFKKHLDFISWDTYPTWHKHSDNMIAYDNSFWHDVMRSILQKPFILMESTPSYTNWQGVSKPKKPGMHQLSSLQALAHGSDSVMYFQWRQSRGASEKFHGSVIQHDGRNDTRFFKEVQQLGNDLNALKEIQGTTTHSEVALIYDWENRWAMEDAQGPRNNGLHYKEVIHKSYMGLRKQGINIDVIDMDSDFSGYKMIVAPMLYMFRSGVQEKIRKFVAQGGRIVMTYWSGVVDEHDLCFLGDTPYDLVDVFGVRRTEFIGLYDWENHITSSGYTYKNLCEVLELEGASVIESYTQDYYKGTPVVTANSYHLGNAYYIGADMDQEFYNQFLDQVVKDSGIEPTFGSSYEFPDGIHVTTRENEEMIYVFVQNFSEVTVTLGPLSECFKSIFGKVSHLMASYETRIYRRNK